MRAEDRLEKLAELRGESVATTERFLHGLIVKLVPERLIDPEIIQHLDIAETGLDWPYAFVRLKTGRTFYGWPSNPTRLRQFWMVKGKLPKTVNANTFGAAVDVAQRFAFRSAPRMPEGGTVIEGGAYIGLKAVRFADEVGHAGKVIAIEINEANCELIRVNAKENGWEDVIEPVFAALASHDGEAKSLSAGHQKHSIVEMDGLNVQSSKTVPAITLDTLVDSRSIQVVDFLNLQVNGGETDVLAGCIQSAERIRSMLIASRYSVNGHESRTPLLNWLARHGFDAIQDSASVFARR